jgi:BetI-type transcriptional repressor, C-terminal
LAAARRIKTGRATALQVERLHALTDGLAVHTALRPELMPPEHIVAVMRLHLDALDNEGSVEPTPSV